MAYRKARALLRASLAAVLLLGGGTVLFSFVWVPAFQAASVDVILSPEELRDRKLIEVVYRTHRHDEGHQEAIIWPFRVMGITVVVAGVIGLVAVREMPPPLVRGTIGMREAP